MKNRLKDLILQGIVVLMFSISMSFYKPVHALPFLDEWLCTAVDWGITPMIRVLIYLGADVSAIEKGDEVSRRHTARPTALRIALENGSSMEGLRAALRVGKEYTIFDLKLYLDVADKRKNRDQMLQLLLEHVDPEEVLEVAIHMKCDASARRLLARGISASGNFKGKVVERKKEDYEAFCTENKYLRSEYFSFSEAKLENAGLPQDLACCALGMAYGDQAEDEVRKNIADHKALKEKIREIQERQINQ